MAQILQDSRQSKSIRKPQIKIKPIGQAQRQLKLLRVQESTTIRPTLPMKKAKNIVKRKVHTSTKERTKALPMHLRELKKSCLFINKWISIALPTFNNLHLQNSVSQARWDKNENKWPKLKAFSFKVATSTTPWKRIQKENERRRRGQLQWKLKTLW